MRKRLSEFARFIVLAAVLPLLAVDIFSLDIAALNGVWTENIMAVGSGTSERNFSWGKGKFTVYGVIFFDLKKETAGISEEGLFAIQDLKQEDANTASMTLNPKKSEYDPSDRFSGSYNNNGGRSYFIRVHFESYNKMWFEEFGSPWREGKDRLWYKMSGPPREMAGAGFEPIESVFGERAGDFCYTVENGKVTVTKYLSKAAGKVDIPSAIKGLPVTTIGYGAFVGCSNLKSVNIPRDVTRIEDSAFGGVGLTSVVIPDGVVSIGDAAFLDCAALTSIVIPSGVVSIGGEAFLGCAALTSVVIPDSVTNIGISAFAGCKNLKSIVLPNNITSIKSFMFAWCSSLETITLPKTVIDIDPSAFEYCSSLASIELPAGLSYIGPSAFQYCSSLKTITIPQGVRQIEPGMFKGCDNLISVKLYRKTRIKLDAWGGTPGWAVTEDFKKRVKIEYMN